jgi:23S rRNA pseudouridine2604 synthase
VETARARQSDGRPTFGRGTGDAVRPVRREKTVVEVERPFAWREQAKRQAVPSAADRPPAAGRAGPAARPQARAREGTPGQREKAGGPLQPGAAARPAPPDAAARSAARPKSPPTRPAATAGEVRISKLLAERGVCSRREADEYIAAGWVRVDGLRVDTLGARARPDAVIVLEGAAAAKQARRVTILLNKPVGYVSGQPEPGCTPAVTLIQPENQLRGEGDPPFSPAMLRELAPAGRLDADSSGLLVLTQDGRVARRLIGEDSEVDKEYLVRVEGELSEGGLRLLRHGLALDNRQLRPAEVDWENEDQLRFVLREGRKRQIRRMCEMVGLKVAGLKRVRIGRVRLGRLPVGKWRLLREDEDF